MREVRCPECNAVRSTVQGINHHLSLQHDATVAEYSRQHVVEFEVDV